MGQILPFSGPHCSFESYYPRIIIVIYLILLQYLHFLTGTYVLFLPTTWMTGEYSCYSSLSTVTCLSYNYYNSLFVCYCEKTKQTKRPTTSPPPPNRFTGISLFLAQRRPVLIAHSKRYHPAAQGPYLPSQRIW